MATQHVVVDGSNIATEGRSIPSLVQLEAAVAELAREYPESEVTVVVDATFAHRIDPSELERFEAAALRGEYVSPPAGAIGRGDAFLLRIAEKVDGLVLSNDSFQEFHGEHPWLFEQGRLLGATPVPGVGWIFVLRSPVRGPRSRVATRDASRAKQRVVKAIAVATKEVVDPEEVAVSASRSLRARTRAPQTTPKALNDPMTFISFIAEHPLGEELEGEVEGYTSHGATVRFGDVICYVPLSGLGDPPPRSARGILRKGERRRFVITALDPHRRGVELGLPGVSVVSGHPSEETVAAEVRMARAPKKVPAEKKESGAKKTAARRRAPVKGAGVRDVPSETQEQSPSVGEKLSAVRRATKATTPRRAARPLPGIGDIPLPPGWPVPKARVAKRPAGELKVAKRAAPPRKAKASVSLSPDQPTVVIAKVAPAKRGRPLKSARTADTVAPVAAPTGEPPKRSASKAKPT